MVDAVISEWNDHLDSCKVVCSARCCAAEQGIVQHQVVCLKEALVWCIQTSRLTDEWSLGVQQQRAWCC